MQVTGGARYRGIWAVTTMLSMAMAPSLGAEDGAEDGAEAARAAIEAANQRLETGIRDGLPGAELATAYTEKAVMLPPGSPPVAGREAIAGVFDGLSGMGVASIDLETTELEVLGDTAIEVGKLRLYDAAGTMIDEASFVVVWKQADGAWLLHRDIWSTDLPPPVDDDVNEAAGL